MERGFFPPAVTVGEHRTEIQTIYTLTNNGGNAQLRARQLRWVLCIRIPSNHSITGDNTRTIVVMAPDAQEKNELSTRRSFSQMTRYYIPSPASIHDDSQKSRYSSAYHNVLLHIWANNLRTKTRCGHDTSRTEHYYQDYVQHTQHTEAPTRKSQRHFRSAPYTNTHKLLLRAVKRHKYTTLRTSAREILHRQ